MKIYRCPCGAEFLIRSDAELHRERCQVLAAALAKTQVTIALVGGPERPTPPAPAG